MKNLLSPDFDALVDNAVDITAPRIGVEVQTAENGVLWVNVDGVCVLRICRAPFIRSESK